MRCHYVSDLHLESQEFTGAFPDGEVLIIAGDLCIARYIDPARTDRYSQRQRARVLGFVETAVSTFDHVLLVAGNHEHFDGVFDDTIHLMKAHLPGVTVLDNEYVDISGVRFFGTSLWSDFEGRDKACMDVVRRSVGEFLLVKTRRINDVGESVLRKFQPEDALDEFDRSLEALRGCRDDGFAGELVVISHHAPSLQGLNPLFAGNGLDGAFASDLEQLICELENVSVWVHGHTHIKRSYRIGETIVKANCRGFDQRDETAKTFCLDMFFEV